MYYDDGPLDGDEDDDGVIIYSGEIRHISIKGNEKAQGIISFPGWVHMVVMDEKDPIECDTMDLMEGMTIVQDGNLGVISKIEPGLYHGKIDGIFLGKVMEEPTLRKVFKMIPNQDGRVRWEIESVELPKKNKDEDPFDGVVSGETLIYGTMMTVKEWNERTKGVLQSLNDFSDEHNLFVIKQDGSILTGRSLLECDDDETMGAFKERVREDTRRALGDLDDDRFKVYEG